jgi:hypothetical protein
MLDRRDEMVDTRRTGGACRAPSEQAPIGMTTFTSPVTGRLFPLQWPVRERPLNDRPTYEVTRRFGDMSIPQYGAHTGVDVGNGFGGDPVIAMAEGEVFLAAPHIDGAKMVWINHGHDFQTRSIHLDRILVHPGDHVDPGDVIGTIGATGLTLLPNGQRANHLHQELWIAGSLADPEPYMNGKTIDKIPKRTEEVDVDAQHDVPVAICRIAPGGTLYADRDRHEILARLWPGGDGIGLYHRPFPAVLPDGRAALARIRIDLLAGAPTRLRDAWIGDDKVRNVRVA